MRHPARWGGLIALLGMATAIVLWLTASAAHRGTGSSDDQGHGGLVPVGLSQSAAHDYNPFGTGPENRDQVPNLVDEDPNTTWSTEQYYEGTLRKAGGTGLGIYLDAAPGVRARAIAVETSTPGFTAEVYVANQIDLSLPYGSTTPLTARGWHGPVSPSVHVSSGQRIPISVSRRWRYYLLWFTTLPPGQERLTLAGVTLYR
jgi:serine/threonine-protein kinase